MKDKKFMKILSTIALVLVLAITLVGCQSASDTTSVADESATAVASTQTEFTLEELAAYDGQNGSPAYIAIDGVVYDVTDVPQWTNGMHNSFAAGQDLSDEMRAAPHGLSKLSGLSAIGTIVE